MEIFIMIFALLSPFLLYLIYVLWQKHKYDISGYKDISDKSFFQVYRDKGAYGEYCSYLNIKKLSAEGKFLANVYVPTVGKKTTEIDIVWITSKGIFVIESKNYSGWIFGSDYNKQWTQTLPGRFGVEKFHFFNPIMQNNYHIAQLQSFLGVTVPYYSVIVFSERCTFKNVRHTNSINCAVIQRFDLEKHLAYCIDNTNSVLDEVQIELIYKKLEPHAKTDDDVKRQHIISLLE